VGSEIGIRDSCPGAATATGTFKRAVGAGVEHFWENLGENRFFDLFLVGFKRVLKSIKIIQHPIIISSIITFPIDNLPKSRLCHSPIFIQPHRDPAA
jgi:hypothetical protein